jgi:hypothetical protein
MRPRQQGTAKQKGEGHKEGQPHMGVLYPTPLLCARPSSNVTSDRRGSIHAVEVKSSTRLVTSAHQATALRNLMQTWLARSVETKIGYASHHAFPYRAVILIAARIHVKQKVFRCGMQR